MGYILKIAAPKAKSVSEVFGIKEERIKQLLQSTKLDYASQMLSDVALNCQSDNELAVMAFIIGEMNAIGEIIEIKEINITHVHAKYLKK
ncbi:MAG: hypothetical protein EBX41_10445 [Chitinophagia bacterium]|nr:hypothetical protein [Chitinophagia bacterium]